MGAAIERFVYRAHPMHVVFGDGTIGEAAALAAAIGMRRALLLTTPQQAAAADAALADLGGTIVARFAEAAMHTPVDVTQRAIAALGAADADGVIAFGGGSTIGLGKAIALATGVPHLAIPTTYAGSEMTPILGQTDQGRKTTLRDPKVLPQAVLYDVALTLGLPPGLSGTSGINAIAHGVEGLYAEDGNPVTRLLAEDGIRALAAALPRIARNPDDRTARGEALRGAWLCGMVLGASAMALHHKLCHTLGGLFDLDHAKTHAIVLPQVVAFNAPAAPEAMRALSRALGGGDPARALFDLARAVGAPAALRDIGMAETGIDLAAAEAVRNPYWNPRPIDRDAIRALIARAWAGDPPS